jgi:alpha-D-ribose 1-methylphosphonate 5-triphosphate synthase subunit PhnH
MSDVLDLTQVTDGFHDPAFDSQAVFRDSLRALSSPGILVEIERTAEVPPGVHAAAYLLLLALIDRDTRLWLSATLRQSPAIHSLRFHTGCKLVSQPADADFAWAHHPDELGPLDAFAQGDEFYPDRSATLIVQVPAIDSDCGWTLSGPGIQKVRRVRPYGLTSAFVEQWVAMRKRHPAGVDVFLTHHQRLVGLPRSTRIEF